MSTSHKLLGGLALLALVSALPLSVAFAQEEEEPPTEHTLTAEGYGLAEFGGWGVVEIHAHGASIIWINGADTLEITGDGEREDADDGVVKLTDWEGEIHIEGEKFGVRMVGGKLDFSAVGKGRAFLQGYGSFQLDDHEGRWSRKGVSIPRRPQRRPPAAQRPQQGQPGNPVPRPGAPRPAPGTNTESQ